MLDRKTKDIDASIELLEDRRKQVLWMSISYISIAILLVIPYLYIFTTINNINFNTLLTDTPQLLFLFGVITIMSFSFISLLLNMAYTNATNTGYYDILMYLKQHETKRKK